MPPDLAILSDEHRIESDCRLVRRAIRKGWPVSEGAQRTVVARLLGIVRKKSVAVPTMAGMVDSEERADGNAIAASRVITQMTGQNQADDHHEDDAGRDEKRLAMDAMALAASLSESDLVAMAIRTGEIHLLPPALQKVALGNNDAGVDLRSTSAADGPARAESA